MSTRPTRFLHPRGSTTKNCNFSERTVAQFQFPAEPDEANSGFRADRGPAGLLCRNDLAPGGPVVVDIEATDAYFMWDPC